MTVKILFQIDVFICRNLSLKLQKHGRQTQITVILDISQKNCIHFHYLVFMVNL